MCAKSWARFHHYSQWQLCNSINTSRLCSFALLATAPGLKRPETYFAPAHGNGPKYELICFSWSTFRRRCRFSQNMNIEHFACSQHEIGQENEYRVPVSYMHGLEIRKLRPYKSIEKPLFFFFDGNTRYDVCKVLFNNLRGVSPFSTSFRFRGTISARHACNAICHQCTCETVNFLSHSSIGADFCLGMFLLRASTSNSSRRSFYDSRKNWWEWKQKINLSQRSLPYPAPTLPNDKL